MKYLKSFLLILIIAIASGCSNENEGSILREFFADKSLSTDLDDPYINFRVDEGENLLFRYTLIYPEEPDIADDEISDIFWFEIPAGETSFSYDLNEDNDSITTFFLRSCFCGPVDFTINAATITAKQINATEWRVLFEMEAQDNFDTVYPLRDEGVYTLKTF